MRFKAATLELLTHFFVHSDHARFQCGVFIPICLKYFLKKRPGLSIKNEKTPLAGNIFSVKGIFHALFNDTLPYEVFNLR